MIRQAILVYVNQISISDDVFKSWLGRNVNQTYFFMKLLSTVQYCMENIAIFNLKGFMDTTGSKKETDLCPLITPKKIF